MLKRFTVVGAGKFEPESLGFISRRQASPTPATRGGKGVTRLSLPGKRTLTATALRSGIAPWPPRWPVTPTRPRPVTSTHALAARTSVIRRAGPNEVHPRTYTHSHTNFKTIFILFSVHVGREGYWRELPHRSTSPGVQVLPYSLPCVYIDNKYCKLGGTFLYTKKNLYYPKVSSYLGQR